MRRSNQHLYSITSSASASSLFCEAERLSSLEVDDKAKARRLLQRQVGRISAFKKAVDEACNALNAFRSIGAVGHEAAVAGIGICLINCRLPVIRADQ